MILKLKRTPGIYLVGFMGSGKSTIGRLLAERIGWHFVDLDEEIEAAERMSILEIFETRGEAEFRRVEREKLREHVRAIECGRPAVLALGGGAIVQPDRKSTRLNSSHLVISYAVFCLKKKKYDQHIIHELSCTKHFTLVSPSRQAI